MDCTPDSLWMVLGSDRILSLYDLSLQGPRLHLDMPKKRHYGRVKSARWSHLCSDPIASMKQQCVLASGDGLGPLRLWRHFSGGWCAWRDQQVVEWHPEPSSLPYLCVSAFELVPWLGPRLPARTSGEPFDKPVLATRKICWYSVYLGIVTG